MPKPKRKPNKPKPGPELESLEEHARKIGRVLKDAMPPEVGFVLCLHDYEGPGNITYISTSRRVDTIKMLEELLGNMKAEQDALS